MPEPRVAIVILTYNGRLLIDGCLEAVRRNTDLAGVEVVVVDNASTDGCADHVAQAHPWVRLVRNGENLGFAGGVNRGIEAVPASAYVLLNTDAQVQPGWLARLEQTARSDARIGIVGAVEVTRPGQARFPEDAPLLAQADVRPVVDLERVGFACALLTRALFDRIGMLDHGYFMYHEDWDLCHRAHVAGFRTVIDARVEVVHEGRASFNRQAGGWKVRVRTMSRQRYQLVHWPRRRLLASVGREAVLFAYWTKEGHPLAYLQGCWTTLRTLPDIRRRRRDLARLRQRMNE